MKRKPVTSSNIKSVGYDPAKKHLDVEFHSGDVYRYHGVTAAKHTALLDAKSIGGHFNAHIKSSHRAELLPAARHG